LREFDVTTERVIDARGASNFSSSRTDVVDLAAENEVLDLFFDLIVEFVTVVPEKFNTVVFVRVVRTGENNASIGAQRSGDVSHTRSRQRSDDENIDAERRDSGNERVLEHVTGKPGVFAEHNLRAHAFRERARIQLRENVRGRAAKLECGLGRNRFNVGDSTNAVRPKNFCRRFHGLTETLRWPFVNGKVLSGVNLLSWRMFTPHPNYKRARFQSVDRALNEFFATRHLMPAWLSSRPVFPWRSFH